MQSFSFSLSYDIDPVANGVVCSGCIAAEAGVLSFSFLAIGTSLLGYENQFAEAGSG